MQDLKALNTRLKAVKGEFPDQGSIIVTAEDTVPYGDLVHVIDACYAAGLMQVSVSGV
jgi:biopolymer transport protein ExbD